MDIADVSLTGLRVLREIAERGLDMPTIDEIDRVERERREREALEWAAAEVDEDIKGGDDL